MPKEDVADRVRVNDARPFKHMHQIVSVHVFIIFVVIEAIVVSFSTSH